jgi:hypothetical protein
MKKLYFFIFFCFLFAGCSKDFLKKYDRRIEGLWELTDVDRKGIGGSTGHLPFTKGEFDFKNDGSLTYTTSPGTVYEGTWDIKRRQVDDGNEVHSLLVTAVDYASQDVKSEYFDEMNFTGINHFKAYINSTTHSYVFRFKRK